MSAAAAPGRSRRRPGPRILLVDDEPALRKMLTDRLRAEGYRIDTADNGVDAATMARTGDYDVIVLDLTLPRRDGLEVCRELRREGADTPVLMLTARDAIADKVLGLKTGADDYMTKPFECSELLARVEALLRRRVAQPAEPAEYRFGDVVVRPAAAQVLRAGRPVRLSAQELKLLVHLVRHPGVLLSRDQLLDAVWGYQATPETRTVDVHVSWLRQKLEPDPHHPQLHRHRVRPRLPVRRAGASRLIAATLASRPAAPRFSARGSWDARSAARAPRRETPDEPWRLWPAVAGAVDDDQPHVRAESLHVPEVREVAVEAADDPDGGHANRLHLVGGDREVLEAAVQGGQRDAVLVGVGHARPGALLELGLRRRRLPERRQPVHLAAAHAARAPSRRPRARSARLRRR